jgi:hypothetical protein
MTDQTQPTTTSAEQHDPAACTEFYDDAWSRAQRADGERIAEEEAADRDAAAGAES